MRARLGSSLESGLTGRVCYQVVAKCSLEADGVSRLRRPEIFGVGEGFGSVSGAVAVVGLGRLQDACCARRPKDSRLVATSRLHA